MYEFLLFPIIFFIHVYITKKLPKRVNPRETHIFLDIDDSLIYSTTRPISGRQHDFNIGNRYVYIRPGLGTFLDFCFNNFENVSIWSHATREWVDTVLDHLPITKEFKYVYSREDAIIGFNGKKYKDVSHIPNAIIVDNDMRNFFDRIQVIPINNYHPEKDDVELFNLINMFTDF